MTEEFVSCDTRDLENVSDEAGSAILSNSVPVFIVDIGPAYKSLLDVSPDDRCLDVRE